MSEHADQSPSDRPDPGSDAGMQAFEARLRAALPAHRVPEPSPDFVEDLLLRIWVQKDREVRPTPEPSEGFVDRVLTAWGQEQGAAAHPAASGDELPPLISLDQGRPRSSGAQERRARAGSQLWIAGLIGVAAMLLAFLAGRASVGVQDAGEGTGSHQEVLVLRSHDQGFVELGSNRFNRAISRVTHQVDAEIGFVTSPEAARRQALMPSLALPSAPEPELVRPLGIPESRRRALGLDEVQLEYR